MIHRHVAQVLTSTGLMLFLGGMTVAQAAWLNQMVLMGGMLPQPCTKDNPYCAAHVPSAPKPQAQFDPNQTPCDSANDACAQQYSKELTQNYQKGVGKIPPPYNPCVSPEACASAEPWWNTSVVKPIENRTIPYDPGTRTWTQSKSCGTIFIGGVYLNKTCPTGTP